MKVVAIPEVCNQQFVQVLYDYLCNKLVDQIHETLSYLAVFSFHHHILVHHCRPEHSGTNLSMRSLLLLDLYQAHIPGKKRR